MKKLQQGLLHSTKFLKEVKNSSKKRGALTASAPDLDELSVAIEKRKGNLENVIAPRLAAQMPHLEVVSAAETVQTRPVP